MPVPAWVQNSVFYQIFPDRFHNGDTSNDPSHTQAWGAPPNRWDYQGGDLRGIIRRFDYLLELGVNALYLNPIFHASANHRYHTIDYFKMDLFLGDLTDFKALIEVAHKNSVRVILDGVLNHCGRGFFAFNHVLENGQHSPYRDWFHIQRFPLDAYGRGKARNYAGWWGIKELPKFNTDNPEVREYLFGMTRYWTEMGIDGWRLDVPNEIDDDSFWAEYRELVKSINPDAYLVGEIWKIEPRWVDKGHFDAVMNYPLRDAILDPLCKKAPFSLLPKVQDELVDSYDAEHLLSAYNPLGSHDTKRVATKLRGHKKKSRLVYAALFAHPGAPAIYYGDEIGLRGGLDPACRGAFPWDKEEWDHELRAWIQKLITIRKVSAALRQGEMAPVYRNDEERVLAFTRTHEKEKILVALNYSSQSRPWSGDLKALGWPGAQRYRDLLSASTYQPQAGRLDIQLAPYGAQWITKG